MERGTISKLKKMQLFVAFALVLVTTLFLFKTFKVFETNSLSFFH